MSCVSHHETADELMRFRLGGQVALIAGGAGGIGYRAALALASVGAEVMLVGRGEAALQRARTELRARGLSVEMVSGDMTSMPQADRVVAATMQQFGRLDVLVNAIGGGAGTALFPAEDYPEADWDRIFDLNLRTALCTSQAAARAMIEGRAGGRILNVSSVRGQLGIDAGYSAYVAAKGALDALTRQHATEWARHGIRVNTIAPTFVRTPQVESLLADREFYERLTSRIPLGRVAETDDLVGAVLFFCSEASAFVSGQILTLDGGLTACQ